MTCKTNSTTLSLSNGSPSKTTTCLIGRRNLFHNPIKFNAANHSSSLLSRVLRLRFHSTTLGNYARLNKRRRFIPKNAYSSSLEAEEELPLLPFPIDQVLVPSESKTLHLYEARYLALLDESLFGKKKHFVHFVLDPIGISDTAEASFAARYGCLVLIEKVERLDVGALVSIRGIGRVKIVKFVQADPYLKGIVIPIQDVVSDCVSKVGFQVMELKEALHCLNSLEIKLKAPKEALLQTQIANSLKWAEKKCSLDCYGAFFSILDRAFILCSTSTCFRID